MTKRELEKELRKAKRVIRRRTKELIVSIGCNTDEVERHARTQAAATASINRANSVAESWEKTCKEWQKMYEDLRGNKAPIVDPLIDLVSRHCRWVN